jgi:hypothetical protein
MSILRSVPAISDAMPLVLVIVIIDAFATGRVGNCVIPDSNANAATKHDPTNRVFGKICRRLPRRERRRWQELQFRGDETGVDAVIVVPSKMEDSEKMGISSLM